MCMSDFRVFERRFEKSRGVWVVFRRTFGSLVVAVFYPCTFVFHHDLTASLQLRKSVLRKRRSSEILSFSFLNTKSKASNLEPRIGQTRAKSVKENYRFEDCL